LRLGYHDEAYSYFWWLLHASRLTQPRLQILYGVDGSAYSVEKDLATLDGYRGSRPVRVGNGAADQVQLDVYGALLETAWLYVKEGNELDRATGKDIAKIADYVCENWEQKDSGIWEVRSEPTHFTQSEHGWDEERGSFVRAPDRPELDASLLTLSLLGFDDPKGSRMRGTVDAIRRDLGEGPLLYRYRGEDGVEGEEGAFLTCSFWLVDALARDGRLDEAVELMEELLPLSNDVGLFSEEMNPETKEFLGNFPQALTHLALVNAAVTIDDVERTGAPK
jgi:GH15 family glucan-1,4-alpha-glucosidase